MVTNGSDGSGGSRRLPDEAFASHARRPDPSRDDHVAFPETSLPPSAWAPAPAAPRPDESREVYVESLQPGVTLYRRGRPWRFIPFDPKPRHKRRGRAKPWIVALVLGAVLYSGATQTTVHFTGDSIEVGAVAPAMGGSPVEIRDLVANDLEPIQPLDQTLHDLPSWPSSVRIEVVASDDATASVSLATGEGDGRVEGVHLPYAAEVTFDGGLDSLWVTASSNDEQVTVQCRVYADGELVAISTGQTTAECLAVPR